MIELTVSEPTAIELEVIEAKIKPEQTKTVTPTYEAQTVLPDAGTTLGQVNVEAIPDPTDIKEIGSNGDHDVRRYGVARVDVQPALQSKTATPTEQAQTILPDTGYDGLESVNIARIPTEYIVPTGTKNISQNGTESVREYDSVNVNVPIPSGYIKPTGTKTITQNGTGINVREFERVDVSVPVDISVAGYRILTADYTIPETLSGALSTVIGGMIANSGVITGIGIQGGGVLNVVLKTGELTDENQLIVYCHGFINSGGRGIVTRFVSGRPQNTMNPYWTSTQCVAKQGSVYTFIYELFA